MKDHAEHSNELEGQIKDLRLEIAKLSALLALRKLESEHPAIEKLVRNATSAENAIKSRAEELEHFAHKKLGKVCQYKSLCVIGRIFLIGSVGYALLAALGLANGKHHKN